MANQATEPRYTDHLTPLDIREYGPDGALRWSTTWAPVEMDGFIHVTVAWAGEDVVAGGFFNGTVDFGSGPQQASLDRYHPEGFLVKLHRP